MAVWGTPHVYLPGRCAGTITRKPLLTQAGNHSKQHPSLTLCRLGLTRCLTHLLSTWSAPQRVHTLDPSMPQKSSNLELTKQQTHKHTNKQTPSGMSCPTGPSVFILHSRPPSPPHSFDPPVLFQPLHPPQSQDVVLCHFRGPAPCIQKPSDSFPTPTPHPQPPLPTDLFPSLSPWQIRTPSLVLF